MTLVKHSTYSQIAKRSNAATPHPTHLSCTLLLPPLLRKSFGDEHHGCASSSIRCASNVVILMRTKEEDKYETWRESM
jgi:hypothetical protein